MTQIIAKQPMQSRGPVRIKSGNVSHNTHATKKGTNPQNGQPMAVYEEHWYQINGTDPDGTPYIDLNNLIHVDHV